MNAEEMFETIGMKLKGENYLLFEFEDGRESYAYFNKRLKEVETCYRIHEFKTKEEFEFFKKAINKFTEELGWL